MDSVRKLVETTLTSQGVPQTRAAARLMTLMQNEPAQVAELLVAASSISPKASTPRLVLGVTGAPGCGKSTLVDAMIADYRRRRENQRVGVIAVDPSSPFTGGAVLGDRVRMMRHATDPGVFVRSLASRGHLGGLTTGVRGVMRVMELLGCDPVILETVGVGQSEVEVAAVADVTMVVLAPGQGDSVQMLKAGLMEIGDLFVINKADRPGADELMAAVQATLMLDELPHEADRPPVVMVSALENRGVTELVELLEKLTQEKSGEWVAARTGAVAEEVREAVLDEVRRRVENALGKDGAIGDQVKRVLEGKVSIAELADEMLRRADRK